MAELRRLSKFIVHEIKKEKNSKDVNIVFSEDIIEDIDKSKDLTEKLHETVSKKINHHNYVFNDSPDSYFPEIHNKYLESEKTDDDFIEFTKFATENLAYKFMGESTPSKGGYLVFIEYSMSNSYSYLSVFLIRDTQGVVFRKGDDKFNINDVEYINPNDLTMACRINHSIIINTNDHRKYLIVIQKRGEVSNYFRNWICTKEGADSKNNTEALYAMINKIPLPEKKVEDDDVKEMSRDEFRREIHNHIKNHPRKIVDLYELGEHFYGDREFVVIFKEKESIVIDTEFKPHETALKKFVTVSINVNNIRMSFPREDLGNKIKVSSEDDNTVIIKSESLANKLKEEMNNNE